MVRIQCDVISSGSLHAAPFSVAAVAVAGAGVRPASPETSGERRTRLSSSPLSLAEASDADVCGRVLTDADGC